MPYFSYSMANLQCQTTFGTWRLMPPVAVRQVTLQAVKLVNMPNSWEWCLILLILLFHSWEWLFSFVRWLSQKPKTGTIKSCYDMMKLLNMLLDNISHRNHLALWVSVKFSSQSQQQHLGIHQSSCTSLRQQKTGCLQTRDFWGLLNCEQNITKLIQYESQ